MFPRRKLNDELFIVLKSYLKGGNLVRLVLTWCKRLKFIENIQGKKKE